MSKVPRAEAVTKVAGGATVEARREGGGNGSSQERRGERGEGNQLYGQSHHPFVSTGPKAGS